MTERNYKSDFKIVEKNLNGDTATPFRFSYYTFRNKVFVAEFDGSVYKNCRRLDDGSLLVVFDNHGLGSGVLMVERKYYLTDADYADGICNLVSVENTGVKLTAGKSDESTVTTEVYPNYQKGDKGDPLTWDTLTDEQKAEMTASVVEGVSEAMTTSVDTSDTTNYKDVFI